MNFIQQQWRLSPELSHELAQSLADDLRVKMAKEWDKPLNKMHSHVGIEWEDPLHDTLTVWWKESRAV